MLSGRRDLREAIRKRAVVHPVDRRGGEVRQHIAAPPLNSAGLAGGSDQRVAHASAGGAGAQVVAADNRHAARATSGGRVIDFDRADVAVTQQRRPELEHVQDAVGVSD